MSAPRASGPGTGEPNPPNFFDADLDLMCVVDRQGRFTQTNRAWLEILGYEPDQLTGTLFMDLVHPGDVDTTLQVWGKAKSEDVVDFVNRYRHKSGRYVAMQWRSRPVGDSVFAVARDATASARLARDPDTSEERYRQTFRELPVGAVIQERSGAIVAANAAALEILGLTSDQITGRTSMDPRWRSVDEHGRDLPGDQHPAMVALGTGEQVRGFVMGVFHPQDNEMRWILVDSCPLVDDGEVEPSRVITTFLDMERIGVGSVPAHHEIAELRHRTGHDALTGLRNRNDLEADGARLLERAERSGRHIAVLYTDVDHFKYINDAISHDAGDEVLRQLAETLVSSVREGDVVARLGGDEFVVVLADVADDSVPLRVAELIRRAVTARSFAYGRRDIPVSVSLGVATSVADDTFEAVLARADTALRDAKKRGRDRAVVSRAKKGTPSGGITGKMIEAALDDNRIESFFQPIVTLPEGRTLAFEALARLRQPDGTIVPARRWIEVAAQNGLLYDVDRVASRAAIQALSTLPEHQWITKNVSADRLHDPRASSEIIGMLADAGVTPCRLTVEITEQVALHATRTVWQNIERLAAAGVTLALDDFGTGYSSMAQLRDYPVRVVKLDRTYTRGLVVPAAGQPDGARERVWGMVRGLADMCRHLSITTVAEGVETEEQARAVAEAGWQLGQGWYFGRESETPREARLPEQRTAVPGSHQQVGQASGRD